MAALPTLRILKSRPNRIGGFMLSLVEEWLKDREDDKGKVLTGVAIISTYDDGSIATIYDGGDDHFQLVGAVEELKRRMLDPYE